MSKTCNETYTKDGWHFETCRRPAKYEITRRIDISNILLKKVKGYRCGLHAKGYPDKRKLEKGE